MLSSAIIVFRETLEATLIIGIIAAATRNLQSRNSWLIVGIGAGVGGSLIVAALTGQIEQLAQGAGQELFNACVLGIAAIMLAWHNIWMARHGVQLARDAKQLGQAVASGNREMSALAVVVALAILREGSETALFLYGLLAGGGESIATVRCHRPFRGRLGRLQSLRWLSADSGTPLLCSHQRPHCPIGGGHDQSSSALPGPSRPPAQPRHSSLEHVLAAHQRLTFRTLPAHTGRL
jgi:hypothetical protein